jgi:glycosyltransferase involved in cell wall biosynthesis
MNVSVVMPAFNAGCCIDKALSSINEQSRPVEEIIVVDDGSIDDTSDIVTTWKGRLPIVLLRNNRNLGIASSLRRGVEACKGNLVLRLDTDDIWLPLHVKQLTDLAENSPTGVLFSTKALIVDQLGHFLGMSRTTGESSIRGDLMWDNPLVHSSSGFCVKAYESVGGYRVERRWEDYDLWIRLLSIGSFGFSNEPTVKYTVSMNSLSRQKRNVSIRARWECQRRAIAFFWKRHPFQAVRCFVLGTARVGISRWI